MTYQRRESKFLEQAAYRMKSFAPPELNTSKSTNFKNLCKNFQNDLETLPALARGFESCLVTVEECTRVSSKLIDGEENPFFQKYPFEDITVMWQKF